MSKQVSMYRNRSKEDVIRKTVYDVLDGNFDY